LGLPGDKPRVTIVPLQRGERSERTYETEGAAPIGGRGHVSLLPVAGSPGDWSRGFEPEGTTTKGVPSVGGGKAWTGSKKGGVRTPGKC